MSLRRVPLCANVPFRLYSADREWGPRGYPQTEPGLVNDVDVSQCSYCVDRKQRLHAYIRALPRCPSPLLTLPAPVIPSLRNRLGRPEVRDRIQNLYFAYLFVLRAVMKAAPLLARYDYVTGLEAEDGATRQLVQQLVGGGKGSGVIGVEEGWAWRWFVATGTPLPGAVLQGAALPVLLPPPNTAHAPLRHTAIPLSHVTLYLPDESAYGLDRLGKNYLPTPLLAPGVFPRPACLVPHAVRRGAAVEGQRQPGPARGAALRLRQHHAHHGLRGLREVQAVGQAADAGCVGSWPLAVGR